MAKRQQQQKKPAEPRAGVRPEFTIVAAVLCFIGGFIFGRLSETINLRPASRELEIQQEQTFPAAPDLDDLIAELTRQAQADPNNADIWTRLGNAYFDSSQPDPAIEAYEKSLALEPNNADVITDAGVMYRERGDTEKALGMFNRAIAANPSHLQSRFNKGFVLLHDMRDAQGAYEAWSRLVEINPSFRSPGGQLVTDMIKALNLSD